MRVDDYLSTVGLIKRRTVAKEMADNGLVEINGRKIKPSHEVKVGDIIAIKGSRPFTVEVLQVPRGSVSKTARTDYYRSLA
jgi:ribosomal 50S subunit-recycling heat shock protein